jgi:hypothetical protein
VARQRLANRFDLTHILRAMSGDPVSVPAKLPSLLDAYTESSAAHTLSELSRRTGLRDVALPFMHHTSLPWAVAAVGQRHGRACHGGISG